MNLVGLGFGGLVFGAYFATLLLYALYLSYCTLRTMRNTGRLGQMPLVVRVQCYVILGVAFGFDVLFNIVVGSIIFLELPEFANPTFTARCEKHLASSGHRGCIARWVCDGWLNPAEPGHCQQKG